MFYSGGSVCQNCGRSYEGLACRPCTEEKSRQALWELQAAHLEGLRAGQVYFAVMRIAPAGHWHLRLYGDPAHTWCGQELKNPGPRNRAKFSYQEVVASAPRDPICPECLDKLRVVEEREAIRHVDAKRI